MANNLKAYFKNTAMVLAGSALSVALVFAPGFAATAQAQSRYDARAFEANTMEAPPAFAPAGGGWRYGVLRRGGCRHAYPMEEQAGCGTATGGPAGGIN